METQIDIRRILWHEMGHFYIDLIDTAHNRNYFIDDFGISYHEDAITEHKWAGSVKTLPEIKWESLVEDIEKTSFTLLNLISGCIFQTYYLRNFLNKNIDYNECFCFGNNCAGRGDIKKYENLIHHITIKYGEKFHLKNFLYIELPKTYYENILKKTLFLNKTNELAKTYCTIILSRLNQMENQNNFKYYFKDNGLDLLKEQLNSIIDESDFKKDIIEFKEKIKNKITL